jgi:multimeric flavodoxin WrbA
MKILAIMGSPHKGNTLECTQRLEKHLKALGEVEFDYLHLKEANLKPCTGCFVCFLRGEECCPLKDDAPTIARKLDRADGVIFASPVYSMHISYLMKQFIDRFAYNFHRPRYFGQYAMTLAVTGAVGQEKALKYLKEVATAWGFDCVAQLGLIAPPQNTPFQQLDIGRKDRTEEVARRFYAAMWEKKPKKLSVSDYIAFRVMQAIYSRMKQLSPTDYAYWQKRGWLEKERTYFSDHVKGNFLKSLPARGIAWMAGRQFDYALKKSEKSGRS